MAKSIFETEDHNFKTGTGHCKTESQNKRKTETDRRPGNKRPGHH